MSKDKGNVPPIAEDYKGVSDYAHLVSAQPITPEQQASNAELAARADELYGDNDRLLGNAYAAAAPKETEEERLNRIYNNSGNDYQGVTELYVHRGTGKPAPENTGKVLEPGAWGTLARDRSYGEWGMAGPPDMDYSLKR